MLNRSAKSRKKNLNHIIVMMMMAVAGCADYELCDEEEKEPSSVTLEVVAVTDSTVTVRWTRNHDDDFSHYAVYYGTEDIVDNNDKRADSMTFSIDTVKTVSKLDDRTKYYFRVLVVNENGRFSASEIVTATTPENMKGKLRLAPPVRDADGKIHLNWTSAIEKCERYAIFADSQKTVDTADSVISSVYSDTAKVLEPLTLGHSWWLRVYAMIDTVVVAASQVVELPQMVGK